MNDSFELTLADLFDLCVEEICSFQDDFGRPLLATRIDAIIKNWTPEWDTSGELATAVWAYMNDPDNLQ